MASPDRTPNELVGRPRLDPARPLWQLAPTHDEAGCSVADFMMLIPGLGDTPAPRRDHVAGLIRQVCESYGRQVVFADINFAINVLWVSVAAEPGLGGRVAASIRQRVPQALLVGGKLGSAGTVPGLRETVAARWRRLLRVWPRRVPRRVGGPGC